MGLKNLTQLMVLPPAIAKEILILINSEKVKMKIKNNKIYIIK